MWVIRDLSTRKDIGLNLCLEPTRKIGEWIAWTTLKPGAAAEEFPGADGVEASAPQDRHLFPGGINTSDFLPWQSSMHLSFQAVKLRKITFWIQKKNCTYQYLSIRYCFTNRPEFSELKILLYPMIVWILADLWLSSNVSVDENVRFELCFCVYLGWLS